MTHDHCTGLLIEKEPGNLQAQSLDQLIEQGMKRGQLTTVSYEKIANSVIIRTEGYVGMAITGGAIAVGTLIVAGLMRRAARKP